MWKDQQIKMHYLVRESLGAQVKLGATGKTAANSLKLRQEVNAVGIGIDVQTK